VDSKYDSLRGGWCSLEPAGFFGVGCGRMSKKLGIRYSTYLVFRWGMVFGSAFDRISGVGKYLLWLLF
jgi:hypothetical protein